MFFYLQREGGHEAWRHELLEAREQIIKELAPRYVSALALSRPITKDTPPEEIEKTKYLGPFYVDFDCEDFEKATEDFLAFLGKLEDLGVNLATLSLFATGGRGYHIEMPMETFLKRVPKDGVQNLPQIYREIAKDQVVDSLDWRVYSGKMGRMWRTPNVKRENGAYKVPITLAEARSMTEERYAQLCSAPRTYVSPVAFSEVEGDDRYVPLPSAPVFAPGMARLYEESKIKVADGAKRNRKNAAKRRAVLEKFRGEFPPTVEAILANIGLRATAGWNQICLQLGITANALGKTVDQLVESARLLIEGHKGDSDRYDTPAKREAWLRSMFFYTHENVTYDFAVGPIRALLEDGNLAVDLEGITDEGAKRDIEQAAVERAQADGDENEQAELERGLVIGKSGIRQRVGNEWTRWCAVGFEEVHLLVNLQTGKPLVFEAEMFVGGSSRGRITIPLDVFLSRQKFHAFITDQTGQSFQGNDQTVQAVQEVMMSKARANLKEGALEFVLRREGLDLITVPDNIEAPAIAREPFPVWVSPSGCVAPKRILEAGLSFRFLGDPMLQGMHQSDLWSAPPLQDSPRLRETLHAAFNMNRPRSVAPMLGWLVAAHARAFYQQYRGAFPLLGVAGEKGAGKSTTLTALGRLHFYRAEFKNHQAFTGTTLFGTQELLVSSASLPVQLDEYKPKDFPERADGLRAVLRGAYNAGVITKGGGAQQALSSQREVTSRRLTAPVAYVGETLETESAIEERTVQVVFDIAGQKDRRHHLEKVRRDGDVFSSIGRELVRLLLVADYQQFCQSFDADFKLVEQAMSTGMNERVVFAYAVALNGLTLFEEVLSTVGVDIAEEMAVLREAVLQGPVMLSGGATAVIDADGKSRFQSKSEAAKTLSDMATMTILGTATDPTRLFQGKDQDYEYDDVGGEEVLELHLPKAWAKYEEWCGRKRRKPLYANLDAFAFGMRNFVGYLDSSANKMDHPDGVMRFRVAEMMGAQVSRFKKKGG